MAPSDDKYYVSAYKVYFNLEWLYAGVNGGVLDMAGGAEQRPTDTMPVMLTTIEDDLKTATAHYKTLMAKDVAAFNSTLAGGRLQPLTARPPAVHKDDDDQDDDASTEAETDDDDGDDG